MPTARAEATAVGYQSKLIVVGGVTWRERILTRLSTVELLDTTGERWYTCSNLPSPHAQLTGVVVDDTLYLLGGRGQDSPSSQVFAVSLSSLSTHQLTWQSLMCTPCCASAGVALYNKYLLAVGGRKQSDDASQANAIHALNPTTGSWVHIADIPAGRSRTAVVAVADNRIMCIGGATRPTIDQNFSNVVWIGAFE
ncbi:kelch domain-containing protein 8B-like [Dysidea avara]|uniref:kelch domain-containing protein 8B-like n=1 Tax=Dysidea avara TaxID=196820 RepID=UPI003329C09E